MGCGSSKTQNISENSKKEASPNQAKPGSISPEPNSNAQTIETARTVVVESSAQKGSGNVLSASVDAKSAGLSAALGNGLTQEEQEARKKMLREFKPHAYIDQDGVGAFEERPISTLFYFDFEEQCFHYYNIMTNEWDKNDLSISKNDCPRCPLFKFLDPRERSEAIQFARYMSYIALSDEVIFIIGGYNSYYSCLEYNISENKFYCREPIRAFRNNPSLYRRGKEIYVVSGDLLDAYSTDVAKYHVGLNEWTTLNDLPGPQGFASVTIINENIDPSLIVLGGFSKKFPKTYAPILSIHNFKEQNWITIDLEKLILVATKLPRFINCVINQTKEGEILILGSEGTRTNYKFDLLEGKLTPAGRLPSEEVFSETMRSKEALIRGDNVYFLGHKVKKSVYKGNLEKDKWEVLY